MRYLITGVNGFVGTSYLDFLQKKSDDIEIHGVARKGWTHVRLEKTHICDLNDSASLSEILSSVRPGFIVHLASQSSVGESWKNPVVSFQNNTNIFLNLVESVRQLQLDTRILSVGSSEQYGYVGADSLPLTEHQVLNPASPYAVARVSQELLSRIYQKSYGLDIVMTRSFNHIGANQDSRFVIPSFVKKLTNIKQGKSRLNKIETGDLSVTRDFVDVRDVVRAYDLLLHQGESGEVYNVCSGTGAELGDVLGTIAELVGVEYTQETNPEYLRPDECKSIVGCHKKITEKVGWVSAYSLRESLQEVVNWNS